MLMKIALHKEYITHQCKKFPHFAQVECLLYCWVNSKKEQNGNVQFKSFMLELIHAKLFGDKTITETGTTYPEMLLGFFDYIAKSNFEKVSYFTILSIENKNLQCSNPNN